MEKKVKKLDWWIEIVTNNPSYIYYFGAFESYLEAQWHKNGYIQDLKEEKAEIININIKLSQQPEKLTIANSSFWKKDKAEEEAATLAKSLGWNVYKNSNNNYTIEIPVRDRELLLKEEESNRWLLICNGMSQAIIGDKEASWFMKEVNKKLSVDRV